MTEQQSRKQKTSRAEFLQVAMALIGWMMVVAGSGVLWGLGGILLVGGLTALGLAALIGFMH